MHSTSIDDPATQLIPLGMEMKTNVFSASASFVIRIIIDKSTRRILKWS